MVQTKSTNIEVIQYLAAVSNKNRLPVDYLNCINLVSNLYASWSFLTAYLIAKNKRH